MQGDEGGIFSKTPDQKSFFFFCFNIKLKQNPGCPDKK